MREVYRVNKHVLNEYLLSNQKSMQGCFIFLGMQQPNYQALNKNMQRIIAQIIPSNNEMVQSAV
jgi:lipopolysaccharide export system protein LptA